MNVLDEIKLKTRFSKEKYHFNRFYGLADFAWYLQLSFGKLIWLKKLWLVYLLKETDFGLKPVSLFSLENSFM